MTLLMGNWGDFTPISGVITYNPTYMWFWGPPCSQIFHLITVLLLNKKCWVFQHPRLRPVILSLRTWMYHDFFRRESFVFKRVVEAMKEKRAPVALLTYVSVNIHIQKSISVGMMNIAHDFWVLQYTTGGSNASFGFKKIPAMFVFLSVGGCATEFGMVNLESIR